MKPSKVHSGARAQLGPRISATALADPLLQTETSDGAMGRNSFALARPKRAGEPGQDRRFQRAAVLRRRQCGGDENPSGWCFDGKGPDLALPGPRNQVHANQRCLQLQRRSGARRPLRGAGLQRPHQGGLSELLG